MSRLGKSLAPEDAETVALEVLKFLAEDAGRLGNFLALTGVGPEELRREAGSPAFLSGVLEHLMSDESLLLAFSANAGIPAPIIGEASRLLARAAAPGTRT